MVEGVSIDFDRMTDYHIPSLGLAIILYIICQ